jgi:hypothetical protein
MNILHAYKYLEFKKLPVKVGCVDTFGPGKINRDMNRERNGGIYLGTQQGDT